MRKGQSLVALTVALAGCDSTPEPTHGVDTTLKDDAEPTPLPIVTTDMNATDVTLADDSEGYMPDQGYGPSDYGAPEKDGSEISYSSRSSPRYPLEDSFADNDGGNSSKGRESQTAIAANLGMFFGRDSYPPAALRAGEEGRVTTSLAIGPDGRVTGCEVSGSSGSASLDETTCRIFISRVRYTPAKDGTGNAIASTATQSVDWRLEE